MNESRPDSDQKREENPSRSRVGCRLGIGDHEKREEKEGSALQLVQGDAHRLAEPEGTSEKNREIEAEKGVRHIAA